MTTRFVERPVGFSTTEGKYVVDSERGRGLNYLLFGEGNPARYVGTVFVDRDTYEKLMTPSEYDGMSIVEHPSADRSTVNIESLTQVEDFSRAKIKLAEKEYEFSMLPSVGLHAVLIRKNGEYICSDTINSVDDTAFVVTAMRGALRIGDCL